MMNAPQSGTLTFGLIRDLFVVHRDKKKHDSSLIHDKKITNRVFFLRYVGMALIRVWK